MFRRLCIVWSAVLLASVFVAPVFGQWQSNSEGIHYDGDNVGIGITSSEDLKNPERHFVVSTGSSVQTILSLNNSGQGHATIGLDADGGQVTGTDYLLLRQKNDLTSVIGNWANKPLVLKTDGTERMRIGRGGNVGVGTSSPNKKLAVAGSVLAEEVIVKPQDQWADVVFEASYDLPTLEKVSAFIDEEGHLPDVPSKESVKENGLRLGDMDATLLQKVEELTLYAIEQEERADSLAERLAGQEESTSAAIQQVRRENDRLRERLDTQQRKIDRLMEAVQEPE